MRVFCASLRNQVCVLLTHVYVLGVFHVCVLVQKYADKHFNTCLRTFVIHVYVLLKKFADKHSGTCLRTFNFTSADFLKSSQTCFCNVRLRGFCTSLRIQVCVLLQVRLLTLAKYADMYFG